MCIKGKRIAAILLAFIMVLDQPGMATAANASATVVPSLGVEQQIADPTAESMTEGASDRKTEQETDGKMEEDNRSESDENLSDKDILPHGENIEENSLPESDTTQEDPDSVLSSEQEALRQELEQEFQEDTSDGVSEELSGEDSNGDQEELSGEDWNGNREESTGELAGELQEEELELHQAVESKFPVDLEALLATNDKEFTIETYTDFMRLHNISKEFDFDGYTIFFGQRDNANPDWIFTNLKINNVTFSGLGNAEHPFRGKLEEYYGVNSVSFTMNRPLFNCVSGGAGLTNFNIKLTNATSGIAETYIAKDDSQVVFNNVVVSGTVVNNTNNENTAAGAIYGTVKNEKEDGTVYKVVVDGRGLDLTGLQVKGLVAGGFIGQVEKNVKIELLNADNLAQKVIRSNNSNAKYAGGIVGWMKPGSFFETTGDVTVTVPVTQENYGTSYGLVLGGIIGRCDDATVVSKRKVVRKTDTITDNQYAGGFIGFATNSRIEISHFQLDGGVRTTAQNWSKARCTAGGVQGRCAGGVIGGYVADAGKTAEEAYLKVSEIGISRQGISVGDDSWISNYSTYENNAGGIAGYIDSSGGMVEIRDLNGESGEYLYRPSLEFDTNKSTDFGYLASDGSVKPSASTSASGAVGGLVGRVKGSNITVSDITLRFDAGNGLGGSHVGGVMGYVEKDSKLTLSEVRIASYFMRYTNRNFQGHNIGGLLGSVMEGCMIRLQGTMDLSGINYTSFGNWYAYNRGKRGYVAGSQKESLIFLEDHTYQNADGSMVTHEGQIIHNEQLQTTSEDDPWYENSVWQTDYWHNNLTSPGVANSGYVLDDIGTYGGVFVNVTDGTDRVIDYDAGILKGTVGKNGQAYSLDNIADALRLSIALNTAKNTAPFELRFGAESCFAVENASQLLSADYLVTADLDLKEAGIYALSRSDSDAKNAGFCFSGTMRGVKIEGRNPMIGLSIVSKQDYGGLFPFVMGAVEDPVEFQHLDLAGQLCFNQMSAGGLAALANGSVYLDDVNLGQKMLTASCTVAYEQNYLYGGAIGELRLDSGCIFKYENGIAGAKIGNIRAHQTVGGLVGSLRTTESFLPESDNIILRNITLKTKLLTTTQFNYGMSWKVHAKVGGLIAYISAKNMHTHMDSWTWQCSDGNAEKTNARLLLDSITINQTVIDINSNYYEDRVRATGGLLGYEWDDAEIRVNGNILVEDAEIKSRGHVGGLITILGSSRFDLTAEGAGIELRKFTMHNNSGSTQICCGFLFSDARYAWINLDASKYIINTEEGQVKAERFNGFDELAGITLHKEYDYINHNGYSPDGNYDTGGILNIILPSFQSFTDGTYSGYKNKVVNQENRFTRYYYNLLSDEAKITGVTVSGTTATATISKPEQFVLWHVYCYAYQKARRFMGDYVRLQNGEAAPFNITKWNLTVDGDMDLNGYSLYPTRLTGGGNFYFTKRTLTLYGDQLDALEAADSTGMTYNQKCPRHSNRQHYYMHASVFLNSSNIKLNSVNANSGDPGSGYGLTIRGTTTYIGEKSSVVMAGEARGTNYLNNIVLDGVRIGRYGTGVNVGLLAYYVPDGNSLYLNGISTTAAYKTNWEANGKKYAAAALVGKVGSDTATNVHVGFKNMKVGGVWDGEDYTPGTENRTRGNYVFYYASFIYYYDTVDNSDKNTSYGVYTFTKADLESGNVTYGDELKYGADYYDAERESSKTGINKVVSDANEKIYLPYVAQYKTILINPKRGDLTDGCGTYEDPYVISKPMQFIMLCAYLGSENGSTMFDVLNAGWKVNRIGGEKEGDVETGRCPGVSSAHITAEYGKTNPAFPTRNELRQAYYVVKTDLDFTKYNDINEYVVMSDFSGFGTTKYPFAGVLIGEKILDESDTYRWPKITLPVNSDRIWENYGFIQFMKGAVVKDLSITYDKAGTAAKKVKLKDGGSGGGVAAVVLGGDNIIDNVTVDCDLQGWVSSNVNTVMTGGYVGLVKAGTVIVRNLSNTNVMNYKAWIGSSNTSTEVTAENHATYYKNSQVIGWVQDGCVIYEDTATSPGVTKDSGQILDRKELFGSESVGLPLSYSFPMVNGACLKDQSGNLGQEQNGKIRVSGDVDHGFTIQMHNAVQMEIAALALNCGAFSVEYTGTADRNHLYAYDDTAVCRKGKYSDVGCGAQKSSNQDYLDVISKDDFRGFEPYLYQYMDFSEVITGTGSGAEATCEGTQVISGNTRYSYLNWHTNSTLGNKKGIGKILTTYQLAENAGGYDLTGFQNSFRGFGELYEVDSVSGYTRYDNSRFRANFDGGNQKVKIFMNRNWDPSLTTIGMFNDLTTDRQPSGANGDEGGFTVQNLKLVNSVFDGQKAKSASVGAVAGNVKGRWNFTNVSLERENSETTPGSGEYTEDCRVDGTGYTGGLIGCINYYAAENTEANLKYQNIQLIGCSVKGVADDLNNYTDAKQLCTVTASSYLGGLVGYVQGRTDSTHSHFGTLLFQNCHVWNTEIVMDDKNNSSSTTRIVGGFVGKVGDNNQGDNVNGSGGRSYGFVKILQEGQTDNDTAVRNVRITSKTGENYGGFLKAAGGLVGMYCVYDSSYRQDRLFMVENVVLDHLQIDGRTSNTSIMKYGIGGVVGCIWTYIVYLAGVTVKNSTIGTADPGKVPDNADHAQVALEDNHRLPVGGMIGVPFVNYVHISASKVQNSLIESKSGLAGGFIGDNRSVNGLELGEVTTNDAGKCTGCGMVLSDEERAIHGSLEASDNTVHSRNQAAGGIVGYNTEGAASFWNLKSIHVENCKVYSGTDVVSATSLPDNSDVHSAGGLVGRTNSSAVIGNLNLKDIRIGMGSEIVGTHAGGLVGYVMKQNTALNLEGDILIGCSRINDVLTDDGASTVILGYQNAGGMYGWNTVNKSELSKADIQLHKLRIGSCSTDSSYCASAGGVAGRRDVYDQVMYDALTVQESVIAGKHSDGTVKNIACGGIYGMQKEGNGKVYLYMPKLLRNSLGYMDSLDGAGSLKKLELAEQTKLRLLQNEWNASQIVPVANNWTDMISSVSEATVGTYGIRIGNYLGLHGVTAKAVFYILKPQLERGSGNSPVIDVGNEKQTTAPASQYQAQYGYGYPYAWQQYCHIIYLEGNDDADNIIQDQSLLTEGKSGYMFKNIERKGEYANTKTGTEFLDMYKLNVKMDDAADGRSIFGDGSDNSYYEKGYGSLSLEDSGSNDVAIKAVVIDGVVPQTALDSFVGIMTNMGGVVKPSGTTVANDILEVKCKRAKISIDGKIYTMTGNASLTPASDKKYIQNTPYTFDEVNDTDDYCTISLVSYRYGWKGVDGVYRYEVIYIPVFVKERITFYSDLHILEGERYSLTDAHNDSLSFTSDNRSIKISLNSTYTLFAEMAYSESRKKPALSHIKLDKVLEFQQNAGSVTNPNWQDGNLPGGVKLTLVDVLTQKAYYYRTDGSEGGKIPFTSFKDSSGSPYALLTAGSIQPDGGVTNYVYRGKNNGDQRFGVEQFFIYVDSTEVKNMQADLYRIRVNTDGTNSTDLNFVDRTQTDGIKISWARGLDIGFFGKEEDAVLSSGSETGEIATRIDGAISKTDTLKIDTRMAITADRIYWNEKNTAGSTYIDSINNGKYLDVALYLYDSRNEQVPFPNGTMVVWKKGTETVEQHSLAQETVIYGYKDWGGSNYAFQIGQITKDVKDATFIRIPGTTMDVSNECHMELSFETANLDDYMGYQYKVVAELRRTSDPDYPLGGDVVDTVFKTVQCTGNKEYAVALQVNDNMNLGINTYHEERSEYEIPFTTKLDFSTWIRPHQHQDVVTSAGKHYQIIYRLRKKVKTTKTDPESGGQRTAYEYEPVDSGINAEKLNDSLTLVLVNKTDNGNGTYSYSPAAEGLKLTKFGGEWVYWIDKQFTEDQIAQGDGTGISNIVGWDAMLKVDTTNLQNSDFSNYELEVTILPHDTAETEPQDDSPYNQLNEKVSWSDFFIFTTAKIKTDI